MADLRVHVTPRIEPPSALASLGGYARQSPDCLRVAVLRNSAHLKAIRPAVGPNQSRGWHFRQRRKARRGVCRSRPFIRRAFPRRPSPIRVVLRRRFRRPPGTAVQARRVRLGTRFRFGVFASLWVANPARGGYGLAPKANLVVAEAHEDAEVARINREARLPLSTPSLVPQAKVTSDK